MAHVLPVPTRTSSYFSAELLPSQSVSSLYCCKSFCSCRYKTLHLSFLNSPRPLLAHSSSLSRFLWMAAQLQHSSSCETFLLPWQQLMFSMAPSYLQVLILFFKNSSWLVPMVLLQVTFCKSLLAAVSCSWGFPRPPRRPVRRRASPALNYCFNFYMDHKNIPCSYEKSIQIGTQVPSWQVNLSLKSSFFYFTVEGKTWDFLN